MDDLVLPSTPDALNQQLVEHERKHERDKRAQEALALVESGEETESSTDSGELADLESDGEVRVGVDDGDDDEDEIGDSGELDTEKAERLMDLKGTTYRQEHHFINHQKLRRSANNTRSLPLSSDASLHLAGSMEFLSEIMWNRSLMCADAEQPMADTMRVKLRHLLKAVDIDPAMEAVFGTKLVEFGAYCSRYVGHASLRQRHIDEGIVIERAKEQLAAREAARAEVARQKRLLEDPADIQDDHVDIQEPLELGGMQNDQVDDLFGGDVDGQEELEEDDRDIPMEERKEGEDADDDGQQEFESEGKGEHDIPVEEHKEGGNADDDGQQEFESEGEGEHDIPVEEHKEGGNADDDRQEELESEGDDERDIVMEEHKEGDDDRQEELESEGEGEHDIPVEEHMEGENAVDDGQQELESEGEDERDIPVEEHMEGENADDVEMQD